MLKKLQRKRIPTTDSTETNLKDDVSKCLSTLPRNSLQKFNLKTKYILKCFGR